MKCWSCGSDLPGGAKHSFTCPVCKGVEQLEEIEETLDKGFAETISVMEAGFDVLSGQLANIASILEWGFEKLHWEVGKMTDILRSIDNTLMTPSMTQANEWRQMAEELRRRRLLNESENYFLKSLDTNPLDYRTYIGLGKTYLQLGNREKARFYWEKSIPHAPKEEFDYRSYSYRLIGRLYFCEGNLQQASVMLKKAVDLSPNYNFAHYDYAQYSALLGDKKSCISSLRVLMLKDPTLLELAERENNFDKLKKEIQVLLQSTIYIKEAQQAVKRAMVIFNIGRKNYFDAPNFLLRDLNPFNRFWDNLVHIEKTMNENYKLAQKAAYKTSTKAIFSTDSSMRHYVERVRSFTVQTTESANKIVDLVRKKYH